MQHLKAVISALLDYGISLSAEKTFVGYPSVVLLGQKVSALGLASKEEMLKAIAQLQLPRTPKQLEQYLGLTIYLRQYILYYFKVTEPLQERKFKLNRLLQQRQIMGNNRKSEAARIRVLDRSTAEL